MDNYISRHWRGELSIVKSFWLSPILSMLIALPVSLYLTAFGSHMSVGELWNLTISGKALALPATPLYINIINDALGWTLLIWSVVGTWRACDNPKNNKKPGRHFLIKAGLVFSLLYGVYDSVSTFTGPDKLTPEQENILKSLSDG